MGMKLIIANGANDTVTPAQLLEHWRGHHAQLVGEHIGPQRYAVTEVAKPQQGYHGIATMHLGDDQANALDPAPPALRADPFYDMIGPRTVMQATEHVIVDGDPVPDGIKITAFVSRSPDIAADRFFSVWLDDHAPNVAKHLAATDGGLRYVVNHATDTADDAPFHGVVELWCRDAEAMRAHLSAVPDDDFTNMTGDALFLLGHEQVLIS